MAEDDAAWVVRFLAGDRTAGDVLFRRHTGLLRDLIRHRMRLSPDDAENVVQGVWLKLLEEDGRRLRRYDPSRPFIPFLVTVALNACRDHLRAEGPRRRGRPLEAWMASAGPASSSLESGEARDALERALATLPPRERMILEWVDVEALPHTEVGRLLRVSSRSVSVLAERARERLRKAMKKTDSLL